MCLTPLMSEDLERIRLRSRVNELFTQSRRPLSLQEQKLAPAKNSEVVFSCRDTVIVWSYYGKTPTQNNH